MVEHRYEVRPSEKRPNAYDIHKVSYMNGRRSSDIYIFTINEDEREQFLRALEFDNIVDRWASKDEAVVAERTVVDSPEGKSSSESGEACEVVEA